MTLVPIEDLREAVNVGGDFNAGRLPQILAGAERWLIAKVRRQLTPLPALVPVPASDPPAFTDTADPHVHREVINGSPFIRVPDAREITKVTVDGREIPSTDYELTAHPFPADGPTTHIELLRPQWAPGYLGTPGSTGHFGRVAEVTGRFGFLELPAELHEAIVTLAARRVYEESVGLVDSVNSDAYGGRSYVKKLPSPIAMVIADFTVPDDVLGY